MSINIFAEISVDADIIASNVASSPELISESNFTFSPTDFTNLPRNNFTRHQ